MTDDLPSSPSSRGPSYDVPVVGDGVLAERDPPKDSANLDSAPTGRIAGPVALGIGLVIVAAVILAGFAWSEDRNEEAADDGTAAPSVDTDALALITTPPTLPPLETVPTVDESPPGPIAPGAPPRDASLLDEVVVPVFPPAPADVIASSGSFDLFAAIDELALDLARRSSTRLELGVAGYIKQYTIVRDPDADRWALDFGGLASITDESSGLSYVDVSSADEQQWLSLENSEIAGSLGSEQAATLYERMLRGPLRPDTESVATVTAGEFVTFPGTDTIARSFEIELPGSAVPEWQLYALGPTDEFLPSDRPDRLTYTVYVDEANQIRRLVGLSDLGGIPQLVVHDIEPLTEPVTIKLPDLDKVIPGSRLADD